MIFRLMKLMAEGMYLLCVSFMLIVLGLAFEVALFGNPTWQWPTVVLMAYFDLCLWKWLRDAARFCANP